MANNFGAKHKAAYVDSPPVNMGTDSSGVRRTFVDTYATGTGTSVADGGIQVGETLTVGVKLRPGSRIIGATLHTDGNGGASGCLGAIQVTDTNGTTTLTGTANMQAGSPLNVEMLDALKNTGGYVCVGEGTISVAITVADLDTGGDGEIAVVIDYLDI